MSRPQRTVSSGTFFITAITHNRRRLFHADANARLLIDTLQHYRREGLYKLHAFVVMPDHIHLLITTQDLPNAMKHIRGGFSHRLASKFEVWQRGYTDRFIQSRKDFDTRLEYLYDNPVRARLCEQPHEFPLFLRLSHADHSQLVQRMPPRQSSKPPPLLVAPRKGA